MGEIMSNSCDIIQGAHPGLFQSHRVWSGSLGGWPQVNDDALTVSELTVRVEGMLTVY